MKFVLFCFGATLISIAIAAVVSFLWKDRSIQGRIYPGVLPQQRSASGNRVYPEYLWRCGDGAAHDHRQRTSYNVMAVVVLSFFQPERKKLDRQVWISTLKGIITNPIILGIIAGLLWSALRLPMPSILDKTVSSVGAVATPLGLMAMGATFDIRKAFGRAKPAAVASVMKLFIFAAVFLPWQYGSGSEGNSLWRS